MAKNMVFIGSDEAGKGDYFGYLVAAAVLVDGNTKDKLIKIHVRDSKRLSDNTAVSLAEKIKKICRYDVVMISPDKYNQLYKKFNNLNKLLAWAHAKAIENLLSKINIKDVNYVIVDQFGGKMHIAKAMMKRGRKVRVIQRTHAERNIAVAAASVIARATFLLTLKGLGKKYNTRIPKGATHVKSTAKKLIEQRGEKILNKVAKKHFKITKQILKEIKK